MTTFNITSSVTTGDKDQDKALKDIYGCFILRAHPGAGKTHTGVHKIAHLIEQGIPVSQILFIVFTVRDMLVAKKALKKLGIEDVRVKTFHGLAAGILRQNEVEFTIASESESIQVLTEVTDSSTYDLAAVLSEISNSKRTLQPTKFPEVLEAYQEKMKEKGLVDFEDLILKATEYVKEPIVAEFVIVDEAHDMNLAEFTMISGITDNVTYLIDPDQAIYSWRGGMKDVLSFLKQYYVNYTYVPLKRCFRHTQSILELVDSIYHVDGRYTNEPYGVKPTVASFPDEYAEAEFIASNIGDLISQDTTLKYGNVAVLFRQNQQSSIIEEYLFKRKIPYVLHNTNFYKLKMVKDIAMSIRYLIDPCDRNLLAALSLTNAQYTEFKTYTEDMTVEESLKMVAPKKLLQLRRNSSIESILNNYKGEEACVLQDLYSNIPDTQAFVDELLLLSDITVMNPNKVHLLTYHKSKGDEFEAVFCAGLEEGLIPDFRSKDGEKNLFYVGCSRARRFLYLTYAESRASNGRVRLCTPSRYITEISQSLVNIIE